MADLSDLYVDSIPAEFNPIFRERRYFDGQYDRNFIRRIGTIAMITPDYRIVSLWDFETATIFEPTRQALADAIHRGVIQDAFLESERVAGHLPNIDSQEPSITWTHYYVELPNHIVDIDSKDEVLGRHRDAVQVFRRTMTEVNLSDLETVLDLINENQLYRGEEFKSAIENWMSFKSKFDANTTDAYIWYHALESGRGIGFRNTVIGTLLTDLYNGEELEKAVRAYESRVAPSNYKRPTSLVTPKMVENAKQTLSELGFLDSVYRRAARLTDIPSTRFLFTTQATRALSVFDELTQDANASTITGNSMMDGYREGLRLVSWMQYPNGKLMLHVSFTPREDEPQCGLRWHKNGEYIGKHNVECEYLNDEVGIDYVMHWDVYLIEPEKD